jgi:pyruvate/2-oxoacid:ferredoxin oxidoreductase alpha subunit
VLDRALSYGYQGILATDVKSALYDAPHRPLVLGMMVGFGGREVNLGTIREVVERTQRALDKGIIPDEAEFIGLKTDTLPQFKL